MIRRAIHILQSRGIRSLARAAIVRARSLLAKPSSLLPIYQDRFIGKSGIEIGGPSQAFSRRGVFPVYPMVGTLDNCNFSASTVWEGTLQQGKTFVFDPAKPAGQQYLAETTTLNELPSETYDFVLSSHMLEHTANPILALLEWKRLLADGGTLVLLLPDRHHTFDHRRPVTTLSHLIDDFNAGMGEDDLTHLPEILALHDLERDPDAGDMEAFKARSLRNVENRCLHHHVFDTSLARELVEHGGFKIHAVEEIGPHHILLLAQKR
ncbi:methyltransferase family protein [Polaromonas sp. CF318]|uniref:methyltransferase domain-containing protein n=1 Tax=Polaromonas sp. CF318 TaxID=1144318 RepID=UPI0002714C7D|nr:methyltransferase domain-containing protein [Polaromonas sp. CF318]EJL82721.1 methyltransferase family protein [Polaromonas sp. CF318]